MNIFNKIVPWFIPTKIDQKKWYTEEIGDIPKELNRLLVEFRETSEKYNKCLGDFEAGLAKHPLYENYMEVKYLAQQTNFLWSRIEYKQERQKELEKALLNLN